MCVALTFPLAVITFEFGGRETQKEEGFDLLIRDGELFVGEKADVTELVQKKLATMKGN